MGANEPLGTVAQTPDDGRLLNSRYIVEPFHLFDVISCIVGSTLAVDLATVPFDVISCIVGSTLAVDLKRPPVYVLGMGQGAPGNDQRTDREPGSPAVTASPPNLTNQKTRRQLVL